MEERCNQIMDCKDKSDENNCKLIVFEENYNKNVPPFSISKDDQSLVPARVTVSTQLENVLAISEFSHTIDLKLSITLEWYENRVVYYNLKSKEALNIPTKTEVSQSKSNILRFSGGIYGISGISMDIPEISMFQDPATHCHQIRRHTLNFK